MHFKKNSAAFSESNLNKTTLLQSILILMNDIKKGKGNNTKGLLETLLYGSKTR